MVLVSHGGGSGERISIRKCGQVFGKLDIKVASFSASATCTVSGPLWGPCVAAIAGLRCYVC